MNDISENTEGVLWMTPEISVKVGPNNKRKVRRSHLPEKRKEEIENKWKAKV